MTEQISLDESPVEPNEPEKTGKEWTTGTAIKVGIWVGAFIGLLFAIGYAGSSAWYCSGISRCPAHPAPFIIAGAFVWVGTILVTTALSFLLHKMYRRFKVI